MLDDIGMSALGGTMSFGCAIKVFPYEWDSKMFQLRMPKSKFHMPLYNVHRLYMVVLWIVVTLRFVLNSKSLDVPPQIRVLHVVWILGYTLTIVCYIQFHVKYQEILVFANSLFAYIQDSNAKAKKKSRLEGTDKSSNVTGYVLMSTFLLFLNPPCHAAAVIHTPCAPNFVSSLIFHCSHTVENLPQFYEKIPWIIAENFVITNFLFTWSFNWCMIFLGLAWIRADVRSLRSRGEYLSDFGKDFLGEYRRLQCRMKSINEAFKYYLAWFPLILVGILALLLYGSIRLWDIPFFTYVNFPTCGLRCLFESMTPLVISGDVSNESSEFLERWKVNALVVQGHKEQQPGNKWSRLAQRSCHSLRCSAGSMYTFDRAIFLVTITNCAQLTLNLLLVWN